MAKGSRLVLGETRTESLHQGKRKDFGSLENNKVVFWPQEESPA